MNRHALALVTIIVGAVPTAALADETAEPSAQFDETKILGVDAAMVMPLGDWGDVVNMGFGPLIRVEIPFRPRVTLTARGGYIHHLAKETETEFGNAETSFAEIPVMGGAKYHFGDRLQYYAAGELGFVMGRVSQEYMGESQSDSDTELGMTAGAGWESGKLRLVGSLFFPDVGEIGDVNAVMISAGYDLSTL